MKAADHETIQLDGAKLRPCREIESIDYDYGESEGTTVTNDGDDFFHGHPWKNWIGLTLRILNPRFQVTIQRKDVDFQTLVGYIGGYIGIFTGFSITQIPDLLYLAVVALKQRFLLYRNKKEIKT